MRFFFNLFLIIGHKLYLYKNYDSKNDKNYMKINVLL